MNSRERVLALLEGQPVDRVPLMPITMMRAAEEMSVPYGRYALDCEVLATAQFEISRRFGFDHVSAITETREARDCGAAIRYFEDQPYAIDESRSLLEDKSALAGLVMPDPFRAPAMLDRIKALQMMKERVGATKIVEGWVEGPCTAAADLRGINRLMLDFHDDPGFVRNLFDYVEELALHFALAQVEAGADVIGIGDPTASLTGPAIYRECTFHGQKRLVDAIHEKGAKVRLHVCGNTRSILSGMALTGADIIDVDSKLSIAEARALTGSGPVLLGGIDPVRILLRGEPEEVKHAALRCRQEAGPRYILGAGCEVPAGTPASNLKMLRDCAAGL